jgi:pectinesterase
MKMRWFSLLPGFICVVLSVCNGDDVYQAFLNRLKADEAYIGFFAAEKKCITEISEDYLQARREAFLGISQCREDPEKFTEPFMDDCISHGLLKEGCKEEWEEVLTILSYELYANMPIFEFSANNITEHRNIIFAQYPNKELALDLFIPEKPVCEPIPCIVCIHGGGWHVNRRVWFEPFAQYLATEGFAAVTIDYRLLPAVEIIDCVHDTKAAVRWVRANADRYDIDPDRIGALGASAGAHLAVLLGTTAGMPELEGDGGNQNASSAVQAVVGIATPAMNLERSARFAEWFGISLDMMRLISPYEHVSAASAPLYLIHGTADSSVAPQDSRDLYNRYRELGAKAEIKWIHGEDHGFYEGTDIAIAIAAEFFRKIFVDPDLYLKEDVPVVTGIDFLQ